MFTDKLIEKVMACKNHTVVGLDPRIDYVPLHIREEAFGGIDEDRINNAYAAAVYAAAVGRAFVMYNKEIIDNIWDIVPAVKPQIAFYEQYGIEGMKAFAETCTYAKSKGMLVIGDVKRGDIGSTAEAYSEYYLGDKEYSADTDCITVNPYLGTDSIEPFIKDCKKNGKGIYILVKTSNKSSVDIQDLVSGGKMIYEHVAEMVVRMSEGLYGKYGYSAIGAVVGATFKQDAARLRNIMKQNYFLVPGYGAQGGTASDITECFNKDGLGAVVNSSRGIIAAYKTAPYKEKYNELEFGAAARDAAIRMRDDINGELLKQGKIAW